MHIKSSHAKQINQYEMLLYMYQQKMARPMALTDINIQTINNIEIKLKIYYIKKFLSYILDRLGSSTYLHFYFFYLLFG